ncbi:glycosyltransferase family 1 protein [Dyadobacter sp. CY356]|uniref:glycosyltransferase family 1 protein n=1 Tax=Dyadobacter sp. CY356 TaxID=2906442 RepID=UPI001F1BCD92|nr:glycosyltransferase family 1 protein [Dyadobacter sp. CY356]MCF0055035.1 glycosyltransferase family 1 protein [Dyadobacter sp. CY356]
MNNNSKKDLLCFSHLRWDFVFQRPQHLMTRFAQIANVYFLEEPQFDCVGNPYLKIEKKTAGLWVCVPHLPADLGQQETVTAMSRLLESFFESRDCNQFIFWYYTPMALEFSGSLNPEIVVYDCMDELSAFQFAPPRIKYIEQQLLKKADVVFTGGASLYEAKKSSHQNIHAFPSSIDKAHFKAARTVLPQPADQASISGLKLGFYGVIDERFDKELIREISAKRPDWQIIVIGPVVKIDPATLPYADNIHYLGSKTYQQLPAYLSGWDLALIPFLLNDSTRFISPTKTPEYLAAGKPVVSSAIRDVVFPYAKLGLVSIGKDAETFITAIESELIKSADQRWLEEVDEFLSDKSWENTFASMLKLILAARQAAKPVVFISKPKLRVTKYNQTLGI